jgi:hypothetical protein
MRKNCFPHFKREGNLKGKKFGPIIPKENVVGKEVNKFLKGER